MGCLGPCTEARRKKISQAQKRSWRKRRAARLLALHNPEVSARRMATRCSAEGRIRASLGQQRRREAQKKDLMALAEKEDVKQSLAVLRQTARPERLPTSRALAEVHRRIAKREAEQAIQPPLVAAPKPARLWNLRRDSSVSHATEPPPMPELRGWQKILCGRLA